MNTKDMQAFLEQQENMRPLLFPRGFLVTDDESVCKQGYPFYGQWTVSTFCGYQFFVHPKQKVYFHQTEKTGLALIGHAFDPVPGQEEISEELLLQKAAALYEQSYEKFIAYFNGWTGLFALFIIQQDSLRVYGDAAGMYTVFYGNHNGHSYLSSHTNLLGDICGLEMEDYINKLIHYRFYSLFGKTLPGDLSPYGSFKRLIPNHCAVLQEKQWKPVRFYPTQEDALCDLPYEQLIDHSAQILKKTMEQIHQKWDRAAISLTGGCDSKTTLSCANGVYDRYSYFSYTSSDSESVDAEAAGKICQLLNVPHKVYKISDRDEDYPQIEPLRKVMEYNSGSIGKNNANDVRKRAFFLGINDFDVEIKSWVSEVVRAYYHKRFGKKKFPKKLKPRYATSLYKVFLTNRKLVRETDRVFANFLKTYYADGSFERIPWYDLFFWEFRMSSWNGLVITGEQQIAYDIAIPYNNRRLLQLLLSTPVEKRAADVPHRDIMQKMNPQIADCGISVVNVKHTNKRAKLERLYLAVNSKLPF